MSSSWVGNNEVNSTTVHALTHAGRNGVEPGRWAGTTFELMPLPKRHEERLLDNVLGVFGTAAHADGKPIHAIGVGSHQVRDGRLGRQGGVG
jgi:hypothetical protein